MFLRLQDDAGPNKRDHSPGIKSPKNLAPATSLRLILNRRSHSRRMGSFGMEHPSVPLVSNLPTYEHL